MDGGIEPTLPKRARTSNDNDYQRFMRIATADEREKHKNLKSEGTQSMAKFRQDVLNTKLKDCSGTQAHSTTDSRKKFTNGVYNFFWVIAQAEGGLMDRDTGIRCARNHCSKMEKRGPPFVMWDNDAGILKYMHFENGISEEYTKARQLLLSGTLDLDSDVIKEAMQQSEAEGLSHAVPAGAMGNFPQTSDMPRSSNDPINASSPSQVRKSDEGIQKYFKPEGQAKGVDKEPEVVHPAPSTANETEDASALTMKALIATTKDPQQKILLDMLFKQMKPSESTGTAEKSKPSGDESSPAQSPESKTSRTPKKSEAETMFATCLFQGKKLDGMITHGGHIKKQAAIKENPWYWARNEIHRIEEAIAKATAVNDVCQRYIVTSNFKVLKQGLGTDEAVREWMEQHAKEVNSAISLLEVPMKEIISMHTAKLRQTTEDPNAEKVTAAKRPKKK
jgi:hypothetical protein